jgi:hypothetical protein
LQAALAAQWLELQHVHVTLYITCAASLSSTAQLHTTKGVPGNHATAADQHDQAKATCSTWLLLLLLLLLFSYWIKFSESLSLTQA